MMSTFASFSVVLAATTAPPIEPRAKNAVFLLLRDFGTSAFESKAVRDRNSCLMNALSGETETYDLIAFYDGALERSMVLHQHFVDSFPDMRFVDVRDFGFDPARAADLPSVPDAWPLGYRHSAGRGGRR
jgi:hypothetical protein